MLESKKLNTNEIGVIHPCQIPRKNPAGSLLAVASWLGKHPDINSRKRISRTVVMIDFLFMENPLENERPLVISGPLTIVKWDPQLCCCNSIRSSLLSIVRDISGQLGYWPGLNLKINSLGDLSSGTIENHCNWACRLLRYRQWFKSFRNHRHILWLI